MFNCHRWNIWNGKSSEHDEPLHDVPLFILVDHEVIGEEPFVRYASLHRYDSEPRILYWKLLDFDDETEEEILQQGFNVIAWRYVD